MQSEFNSIIKLMSQLIVIKKFVSLSILQTM